MSNNVYPCIIYQRLRPSAQEASQFAAERVWPLVDKVVEQEGFTPCGLYGDSEFAPPFCGSSEIRPGLEAALAHAKRIASKVGICTLLIGDAAPIGDGDPFLPAYLLPSAIDGVSVRLVNFHLTDAQSTNLPSAWRSFELYREQAHDAATGHEVAVGPTCSQVGVLIERAPDRLLGRLYLANPTQLELRVQWKLLIRKELCSREGLDVGEWREIAVPSGRAVYLETVLQGELPWARQLRIKGAMNEKRLVGSVHLSPADMMRDSVPFVWEPLG